MPDKVLRQSFSPPTSGASHDFSNFKVLVVDDSRTLRLILSESLAALGIRNITLANDGEKALARLQEEHFDLMLLDMEMPEMDGLEVLRTLRAEGALHSMSVIVISGISALDRAYKCIENGADDYLPKPFNPVLFKARIYACFERKRLRDLEREHLKALNQRAEHLEYEQLKSEKLMLNIFPKSIAQRLKRGEQLIAGSYSDVSILFGDLIGFTDLSSHISATELVRLLNNLVTRFDKRAELLGVEKIKTIGDAYMVAAGVPIPRPDHAQICADMALGMFEDLASFNRENSTVLNMRIGIASGPAVAGVIGYTKYSYDLWGNTVNVASRMESTSLPGRIQLAPTTAGAIQAEFDLEEGGQVFCKGLGAVSTHFLLGRSVRPQ